MYRLSTSEGALLNSACGRVSFFGSIRIPPGIASFSSINRFLSLVSFFLSPRCASLGVTVAAGFDHKSALPKLRCTVYHIEASVVFE